MSRFVRPALAAAVLALASGPALAADLPSRKAPPPVAYVAPPPVFTWTGFYVGLNAGAAIDNTRYGWSPFSPDYRPGGVAFAGGAQAGYNWQTGPLVLGVETDIAYRGASGNSNNGFGALSMGAGYFGTARARLGRTRHLSRLFKQIRAADIADEDKITGEDADRLIRADCIGD